MINRLTHYRMNKFIKIALWLLLLMPLTVLSQDVPPKPNPPRLVNDFAGVLSVEQVSALERKLVAYDDTTSNQLVVVLVKSLNDYPIEEYSTKLFREWQIGNKEHNNGLLILAAIDDHKLRIETGYGLEGAIPDITANQIITNDIVPAFRRENYYEGLNAATNSIIAAAAGEYKAPENYAGRGNKKIPFKTILIIIVLIIIFAARSGRGGRGGGGFLSSRGFAPFILGSMLGRGISGGGGGGWSGGGGGFGGFGGGSSGGGGASGSW